MPGPPRPLLEGASILAYPPCSPSQYTICKLDAVYTYIPERQVSHRPYVEVVFARTTEDSALVSVVRRIPSQYPCTLLCTYSEQTCYPLFMRGRHSLRPEVLTGDFASRAIGYDWITRKQ